MPLNLNDTAEKLGISPPTVKRWLRDFSDFVINDDQPTGPGKPRVLNDHNIRILYTISQLRNTGYSFDEIRERLSEQLRSNWENLIELPEDWYLHDLDGPSELVLALAERKTQVALLQKENTALKDDLEKRKNDVIRLQTEVKRLESDLDSSKEEIDQVRNELATAQADLARLQGSLDQYTFGIADKPINVGLIVLVAVMITVVIVILIFVAARFLL